MGEVEDRAAAVAAVRSANAERARVRSWARGLLLAANQGAALEVIERYLDAYADYRAAQANIDEHGTIVLHPRTAAPIENPYLKIRAAAAATMERAQLDTDDIWQPS